MTSLVFAAGEPAAPAARFERELVARLLRSADPRAVPVAFHDDTLFAIPDDLVRQALRPAALHGAPAPRFRGPAEAAASEATPAPRPRLAGTLRQALRRTVRFALSRLPYDARQDASLALVHARAAVLTSLRRQRRPAAGPAGGETAGGAQASLASGLRAVVHPERGDVLFAAGLASRLPRLRALAELRQKTEIRVACLCDGLPGVLRPDIDPLDRAAAASAAEAVAMLDAADLIWCPSAWSAEQLRGFAASHGRAAPPIELLRPGHDAPRAPAGDAAPLPPPLAGRRFALAADTVEARANHALLLRCWERLTSSDPGFPLDLVIVGSAGSAGSEAEAGILASPLLNQRVFWLDACPASVLDRLHAAAQLFLHPALLEEHALPLAAARAHGAAIIASRTGALAEVAGSEVLLLDPTDDEAWLAVIRAAASRPRRAIAAPPLPSWDDVAARVHAAVRQLAEAAAREAV